MTPLCRFCAAPLEQTFVDLGQMPIANAYPSSAAEALTERTYPLHARVCTNCFLVQVDASVSRDELFRDYAYFSSLSTTWLEHARRFAKQAMRDLRLGEDSLVIEVASNDGYLLRLFRDVGVPVLGIDPAANVAAHAIAAGIDTEVEFFGLPLAKALASTGRRADLLIANNVFAHVPDPNDFAAGLAVSLKPQGIAAIEVPHLLNLIARVEFDTIYHEHFSYFSLWSAEAILRAHGLVVFDVEELPTHGGSLRIWAAHADASRENTARLAVVRRKEIAAGLNTVEGYAGFAARVERCRSSLLGFLSQVRERGESIAAYGAAAKGNTLLNYCKVGEGDIRYVVDRSAYKVGRLLPGSHLPIYSPEKVAETRPEYLLILPWNLKDEICEQMGYVREWGCNFVTAIPEVALIP